MNDTTPPIMMSDHHFDINIAGELQLPTRLCDVDFLTPTYHMRTCLFFRNPIKYDLTPNVFLKPFSTSTWMAVVAMATLILLLLKVIVHINKNLVPEELTWTSTTFAIFSIICQQGSNLLPRSLLFLILLLWSVLLFNYYSSSMVVLLLNYAPPTFHSLEELTLRLEIEVDKRNCYITQWLKSGNVSDVKLFNAKLNDNFCTIEEAFARVARGHFAYYTDYSTAYAIVGKKFKQEALCDMEEFKIIPPVPAGFVLQKRSQFFELFQVSLRRLHERGLVNRFQMVWEIKRPDCYSNSEIVPVGLDQTRTAFLSLTVGALVAMFCLILEVLWARRSWRNIQL